MALNQHVAQNMALAEAPSAPPAQEYFADLFNLSRLLNQTNRLDQILKTIARHSLSLLQVVYCRILTLEEDGRLITRLIEIDERLPEMQRRRLERLPAALREYRQVLHSQGPVVSGVRFHPCAHGASEPWVKRPEQPLSGAHARGG